MLTGDIEGVICLEKDRRVGRPCRGVDFPAACG
jgi:hypothetical protein